MSLQPWRYSGQLVVNSSLRSFLRAVPPERLMHTGLTLQLGSRFQGRRLHVRDTLCLSILLEALHYNRKLIRVTVNEKKHLIRVCNKGT